MVVNKAITNKDTAMETVWGILGFLWGTVIIKGIVAHWIADRIVERVRPLFDRTPRREAILAHFTHRHKADIADCGTGNCGVVFG